VAFEYFCFDGFFPALSQAMIYESESNKQFALIVESSHSATYIVPFFDNEVVTNAIKRVDVGGKLLTNHLKEIVSMRYYEMKNELRLVEQIKEEMMFCS